MGVAASFVLFSSFGGVVGGRCGIGGSSCLGNGVDDTDVDEVGGCLVVGDDVEPGLFVLCCAGVSVKFGDVYFELCVVTVLLEPFLEDSDEGVVAVCSVAPSGASGGVLCEFVKLV